MTTSTDNGLRYSQAVAYAYLHEQLAEMYECLDLMVDDIPNIEGISDEIDDHYAVVQSHLLAMKYLARAVASATWNIKEKMRERLPSAATEQVLMEDEDAIPF